MKILKLNPRKSKAQAMVEFAIVLPILLLVVYGLIETGRLLFIYSSVTNVARQAARYGSTSGVGPNGVARYLDCKGIRDEAERVDFLNAFDANDDAEFIIEYDQPTGANPDPGSYYTCTSALDVAGADPETGDRVTIRINATVAPLLPLVPIDPFTINAESSRTLLLTISIQPPKENTTTLITADTPDPSEVGQPVTVNFTVTATTVPTGAVQITGADTNCSATLDGSGSGSCVVIFSTFSGPGSEEIRTLTATYVGDDTHNPSSDTENHTVKPTSTETEITADTPDPSLVGATVTVEAEVSNKFAWGGIPLGTVDITGPDTTGCTINLSGGTGTCTLNFTATGTKTLTAVYNPTSPHATSSDTELHEVIPPGATVTRIISPVQTDEIYIGQSVTVTFAVTSSTTPTGTVTITGQSSGCTTPVTLSGGTGSCTVIFNTVNNTSLTATYTPDTTAHTGSSHTVNYSVDFLPTITRITAPTQPSSSSPNDPVIFSVEVIRSSDGLRIGTGNVEILNVTDSNSVVCTISLSNGVGSCTGTFTSSGIKSLIARYSGDNNTYAPSDSAIFQHTVSSPTVVGCNTTNIILGLLQQSGSGAMTMTINNTLSVFLQIDNVTVVWNHDKGHQTGGDKTLILQSASLTPGSTFWTGSEIGPTYTITPASPTFIPPGSSTISFFFHQIFDRWDNTESITINLSNPGCEGVVLFQNQH